MFFENTSVMDLINRLDNFHYLLKRLSDSFDTLTVECYRGVRMSLLFLVKIFFQNLIFVVELSTSMV